jgi:hypothetical protein
MDAVRKSWEGTFDRFAEISVSMKEPQIHVMQNVAWEALRVFKGSSKTRMP